MDTREKALERAAKAAMTLRLLTRGETPDVTIIGGTGWSGIVDYLDHTRTLSFEEVEGLCGGPKLKDHAREYIYGLLGDTKILFQNGRFHLNEAPVDPEIYKMVRLQVEAQMELGVKKIIITSGVGCLPGSGLMPGDIMIVDSFLIPDGMFMPAYAGEFVEPETALSERLMALAQKLSLQHYGRSADRGTHKFVLGPWFENRRHDKQRYADMGAKVVGMSMSPEVTSIMTRAPEVEILCLALVTNEWQAEMIHEDHTDVGKKQTPDLARYLKALVSQM